MNDSQYVSYRQIIYVIWYSIIYVLYWQNTCIMVIVFIMIMHQEAFHVRNYFNYLPVNRVPYYWITSAVLCSLAVF